MNCNVVKDLIPLCIDGCCSEESEKIVKEHIESCDACRKLFEDMSMSSDMIRVSPDMILVSENMDATSDMMSVSEDMDASSDQVSVPEAPVVLSKINDWKASVLQSVLLFLLYAAITIGVALEAKTPAGPINGFWALALVIPATGFMLSLANWYFVRLYKSRKSFSNGSFLATLGITVCAYLWAGGHYDLFLNWIGFLLTVVFCVLSKALSNRYAKMLGKE